MAAPTTTGTGGLSSPPAASVLIVDDDPGIRLLVSMVLRSADGAFVVAGEASSGEEAIERWRELRPDVIVLDHRLPGMNGLDVARLILADQPAQVIVVFTAHGDPALTAAALALGVRACVPKTDVRRLPAEVLANFP